jgi:hypothetical protein
MVNGLLTKVPRIQNGERIVTLTYGNGKIGYPHLEK